MGFYLEYLHEAKHSELISISLKLCGRDNQEIHIRQAEESDYMLPLLLKICARPLILLFFICAVLSQNILSRFSLGLNVYLPTLHLLYSLVLLSLNSLTIDILGNITPTLEVIADITKLDRIICALCNLSPVLLL